MTSDEKIAEAVREYPCLYEKARKGHCDRDLVKNCWLKVAEKCGFEDEEEAKRLFNNLKKRYNKARNESTCASGSGRKDAIIKKKKFEEYSYLSWLQPFIKLRSTQTNLQPTQTSVNSSEGDDVISSDESEAIVSGTTWCSDGFLIKALFCLIYCLKVVTSISI